MAERPLICQSKHLHMLNTHWNYGSDLSLAVGYMVFLFDLFEDEAREIFDYWKATHPEYEKEVAARTARARIRAKEIEERAQLGCFAKEE